MSCIVFLVVFLTWRLSLPPSPFRRVFFLQQTSSLPPCLFVVLVFCFCIIHCGCCHLRLGASPLPSFASGIQQCAMTSFCLFQHSRRRGLQGIPWITERPSGAWLHRLDMQQSSHNDEVVFLRSFLDDLCHQPRHLSHRVS